MGIRRAWCLSIVAVLLALFFCVSVASRVTDAFAADATVEGEQVADEATPTYSMYQYIKFFLVDEGGVVIHGTSARFRLTNASLGMQVYDGNGNYQTEIEFLTSPSNPEIVVPVQAAGEYDLWQIEAPVGYELLEDVIVISITDDGTVTARLGDEPFVAVTDDEFTIGYNLVNMSSDSFEHDVESLDQASAMTRADIDELLEKVGFFGTLVLGAIALPIDALGFSLYLRDKRAKRTV